MRPLDRTETNLLAPSQPISAGVRNALGLEVSGKAALLPQDSIGQHIAPFIDVQKSEQVGEPAVTARSTNEMLNALGIKTMAGGLILTKPFSIPQGHSDYVAVSRIREGIRAKPDGAAADTGEFDKSSGDLKADKIIAFWQALSGGKGYATVEDVDRYVAGPEIAHLGRLQLRKPGRAVNELEIRLFFDLAAQVNQKGERVLTADRLIAFLDGTLFTDFAKARLTGRLYQPRSEILQDAPRTASVKIAAQDAAARALQGAELAIDEAASLKEQQRPKTLLPTIFGALKAISPLRFA